MKKIFGLLAICALTLVGCNDTPEPEPIVKAPVVTLDKESVEAPAEGGTFSVNYTIENAVEGVALSVTENAEWISDVVASEGVITFTVAANDVEEQRDAVLNVEYTGAEARAIAVAQAAKSEEPTYRTEEDSITRFDNKSKRNKRNKRNRGHKNNGEQSTEPKQSAENNSEAKPQPERAEKPERQKRHEKRENS